MVDQGAYRGSVVTSGTFTEEAEQFAEGKPMELVDGERLERMIREVGGTKAVSSHPPNTPSADRVTECPRCGSPLICGKHDAAVRRIGVLWLLVVSEMQLCPALGAKHVGRLNMPDMRVQPGHGASRASPTREVQGLTYEQA